MFPRSPRPPCWPDVLRSLAKQLTLPSHLRLLEMQYWPARPGPRWQRWTPSPSRHCFCTGVTTMTTLCSCLPSTTTRSISQHLKFCLHRVSGSLLMLNYINKDQSRNIITRALLQWSLAVQTNYKKLSKCTFPDLLRKLEAVFIEQSNLSKSLLVHF